MTKKVVLALALFVAASALPHAQPVEQAEQLDPGVQKRRNKIQLMEGLLARAGSIAADTFGRKLQQIEPSMTIALIGQSRARGFMLEGYGIFFDVEVPELRGTVVLFQQMMQRDVEIGNALAMLKRALQDMPAGPSRLQAQQALRVLDVQAGPVQSALGGSPVDVAAAKAQDPALKVSESTAADAPAEAPPPPISAAIFMKDPRKEYRDTVQRELIEAMLDYSVPMEVGPDEWLSVAARVAEPGERGQTLMLRIKGSDLAIYAADPKRRDEIRGKVEVRVF